MTAVVQMSLVSRLVDLVADVVRGRDDAAPPPSDRLAAAALLVHVARVDGRIDGSERELLLRLLAERFGLDGAAAGALLARADDLDRDTDDIATLIEMLGHGTDDGDRRGLLAMAYGVGAADGKVGEFEDDLLWRMAHLLGLDDDEIDAVRTGRDRSRGGPDA